MTDELTSGSDDGAPNRRRFITTAGIGAAGVWAAPAVVSAATASAGASPVTGGGVVRFSEFFAADFPEHEAAWAQFRSQLDTSTKTFTMIRWYGSNNPTGFTCSDPAAVAQIADRLHDEPRDGAGAGVVCGGHTWYSVQDPTVVWLELDLSGNCSATAALRPDGLVGQFSGVDPAFDTCNQPPQQITLEFHYV